MQEELARVLAHDRAPVPQDDTAKCAAGVGEQRKNRGAVDAGVSAVRNTVVDSYTAPAASTSRWRARRDYGLPEHCQLSIEATRKMITR